MGDFDIAQLENIFNNLIDKLESSKKDEMTPKKLDAINKTLASLKKILNSQNYTETEKKKDAKILIKEFFTEWKQNDPLKGLHDDIHKDNDRKINLHVGKNKHEERKDLTKSLFGNTNGFSAKIGHFIGSISKLDGSFTGLFTAVGTGSTLLLALTGFVDEQVDSFRRLVSTSEGSIGSLDEMNKAASIAKLSVNDFSKAIEQGSHGVRILGATRWANVYNGIKQVTKQMGYFGYTFTEIQDAQSNYLDILYNQGRLYNISNTDVVGGLNNLLTVNNKMAYILGENRKDTLELMKQQSMDKIFNLFERSRNFNEKQINQINATLVELTKISPELATAVKEMSATGGAMISKEGSDAYIAAMTNGYKDIIDKAVSNIRAGTVDAVKISNEITNRVQKNPTLNGNAGTYAALAYTGAPIFQQIAMQQGNILSQRKLNENPNAPEEKKPKLGINITDEGTKGLLRFQGIVADVAQQFRNAMTNTILPVMELFGKTLNNNIANLSNLSGFVTKLTNSFGSLSGFIKYAGYAAIGLAAFNTALSAFNIVSVLGKPILGLTKLIGKGFINVLSDGFSLFKGLPSIISKSAEFISQSGKFFPKLIQFLGPLSKVAGPVLGAAGIGYSAYDIAQRRNKKGQKEDFFGKDHTVIGALTNSRASDYGQSAIAGAGVGAAIGSIVPVLGTAAGAAVGAGVGVASTAVADFWDDIFGSAKKDIISKGNASKAFNDTFKKEEQPPKFNTLNNTFKKEEQPPKFNTLNNQNNNSDIKNSIDNLNSNLSNKLNNSIIRLSNKSKNINVNLKDTGITNSLDTISTNIKNSNNTQKSLLSDMNDNFKKSIFNNDLNDMLAENNKSKNNPIIKIEKEKTIIKETAVNNDILRKINDNNDINTKQLIDEFVKELKINNKNTSNLVKLLTQLMNDNKDNYDKIISSLANIVQLNGSSNKMLKNNSFA